MKLVLRKLEHEPCKLHTYNEIAGCGYITNLVEENKLYDVGTFYGILPDNAFGESIYEFNTGGRVFPYIPPTDIIQEIIIYPKQIVLNTIAAYVKSGKTNTVLIEDYYTQVDETFLKREKDLKYFLANGKLLYKLSDESPRSDISRYYLQANNFPFMLLFVNQNLSDLVPFQDINEKVIQDILRNISAMFLQVYDMEGSLFWIKNESDPLLSILYQQLLAAE